MQEYTVKRLRDEVRGKRSAQAALAREFKVTGAHMSNVLSDEPTRKPGEQFLRMAAAHWGMSYAELEAAACGPDARPDASASADPPVSTFLMRLDRLPGLRRWIEDTSSRLTISQVAAGIEAYDANPPRSGDDGVPLYGWGAFFRDVAAGKFSAPMKIGDQAAAEALELSQLSPEAQAHLKGAAKKDGVKPRARR